MINLITGMPGNGKTLFTIAHVMDVAEKEKRDVYYSGIRGCAVPGWIEFGGEIDKEKPWMTDPSEWYKLPDKAIIIIDECQRLFRPRSFGSKVPLYISELETHRHRGLDLYIVTQSAKLVDSNIRGLVGIHRHVVRSFGLGRAMIHSWENQTKDNPEKPSSRTDSMSKAFTYPKNIFDFYKSAEAHTHKRSIPKRVLLFLAIPFIIGALVWTFNSRFQEKINPKAKDVNGVVVDGVPRMTAPIVPALTYAMSHAPEVPGLAFTAPAYSEVTKPKRAPAPVACVSTKTRCGCYTQDGTKLGDVPELTCRSIVVNGFFMDWVDPAQQARAGQSLPAPAVPVPVQAVPVVSSGAVSIDVADYSPSRRIQERPRLPVTR